MGKNWRFSICKKLMDLGNEDTERKEKDKELKTEQIKEKERL